MSIGATAKNWNFGERGTPKRIELLGDKHVRPESAEYIIEFPGGAVEVARTSDGDYWCHIIVHHGQVLGDAAGSARLSARGEVIGSRLGRVGRPLNPVEDVPDPGTVEQIAVLIRPHRTPPVRSGVPDV